MGPLPSPPCYLVHRGPFGFRWSLIISVCDLRSARGSNRRLGTKIKRPTRASHWLCSVGAKIVIVFLCSTGFSLSESIPKSGCFMIFLIKSGSYGASKLRDSLKLTLSLMSITPSLVWCLITNSDLCVFFLPVNPKSSMFRGFNHCFELWSTKKCLVLHLTRQSSKMNSHPDTLCLRQPDGL